MTGIIISIRITSISPGLLFLNISTASCPFHALVTTAPSFRNINSAISIFNSLSSTRRICNPFKDFSDISFCFSRLSARRSILNGTLIKNIVPAPSLLLKVMVPPIFSTSFLLIGIPSPVPAYFVRLPVCSCAKGSKMCFWNASFIPIPVSLQANSIVVISGCSDRISLQLI